MANSSLALSATNWQLPPAPSEQVPPPGLTSGPSPAIPSIPQEVSKPGDKAHILMPGAGLCTTLGTLPRLQPAQWQLCGSGLRLSAWHSSWALRSFIQRKHQLLEVEGRYFAAYVSLLRTDCFTQNINVQHKQDDSVCQMKKLCERKKIRFNMHSSSPLLCEVF